MHIFFTILVLSLFGLSIVLSNWLASVACSLLLLLLFITRFLATRIVKRSFQKLTPLDSTVFSKHSATFKEIFSDESPRPKVFVAEGLDPVQMYAFGDYRKINLILSPKLLKHVSDEDLRSMFKQAYTLSKNPRFLAKKHMVALFLMVSSVGRYIDAMLSFFLGIKTKSGEPKALTRKIIFAIAYLFKTKPKFDSKADYSLRNYSYLNFYHEHPILGPLSIADMNM